MATNFVFGEFDGQTNDATPVVLSAAPASGVQRQLKSIFVHNGDTAAATVLIQYVNGVTTRTISQITLSVGDELQFNENDLIVLDTTSKSLQIVLSGPITTNQLTWFVSYSDFTP